MARMHKDATGRDITRGAYVAYAIAAGSKSAMKFGAVIKLKEEEYNRSVYDSTTRTWQPTDITEYSIQVVSVERARGAAKWAMQGKAEGKLARAIHIDRLDRCILLDPHQMDPEAKELLDKELQERGA
jgi:hypothetical protein